MWSGHGKQLPNQSRCLVARGANLFNVVSKTVGGLKTRQQQIAIQGDASQQIVEVVSHSADEAPYRFHLLRFAGARFITLIRRFASELHDLTMNAPAKAVPRLEPLVVKFPQLHVLKNWLATSYSKTGRQADADAMSRSATQPARIAMVPVPANDRKVYQLEAVNEKPNLSLK